MTSTTIINMQRRPPGRMESGSERARRSFFRRIGGMLAGFGVGGAASAALRAEASPPALAGLDPLIGEIVLFAGNFAPRGWAFCDGQLLAVTQYTALFSILGTTYGGDGRTTFALPDLRGRVPIHPGSGPGLSSRQLGQTGGSEQVTLAEAQMPGHSHAVSASSVDGGSDSPSARLPARPASGIPQYGSTPDTVMASNTVQPSGGGQPHENMPPFLGLNYIIALEGIFPSRN
jgi:microcystin-dependent protein